jgi:uncharacterized protein with GYD domain
MFVEQWEETIMPTFIIMMNWTEQGIHNVKDAPKRAAAAKEMAKKLGVEIKQTYLTNGQFDLVSIVESASGDNIAKFCMQIGALGNVRTRTVRAWSQDEYMKLISELS